MVTAWRIVKSRHAATALSGEGAARTGGRWNSRGTWVVYTSATQSLAALEILVHLNPQVSFQFSAFPIELDDSLVELFPDAQLPPEWQSQPPPASTQQIGDQWLKEQRSAVLSVPSVLIPSERNYLLNPGHRDFSRIVVGESRTFTLDPRLIR